MSKFSEKIESEINKLPPGPGVYLFKNSAGEIIYIGKAKSLKKRVSSYLQNYCKELKALAILSDSQHLDHIETASELEAMLLEAKLIQNHQPKHNVIFKTGQPFLYLLISAPSNNLPELKVSRTKDEKGEYFGPFIEKKTTRNVFKFLETTFSLRICGKKIDNGCLFFHLGICAGSCKQNFDKDCYKFRLNLARQLLKKGHRLFLKELESQIRQNSEDLDFEKSQKLLNYQKSFERVFEALGIKKSILNLVFKKDVWVLTEDKKALFLFEESNGHLTKRRLFCSIAQELNKEESKSSDWHIEYFRGYYREVPPPGVVLVNFALEFEQKNLIKSFLSEWHKINFDVKIDTRNEWVGVPRLEQIFRLTSMQAEEEIKKRSSLAKELKRILKLESAPISIDCFDVSGVQGMFMVGSCIRFVNGHPDKNKFRRFKIKIVKQQNDYACIREIVHRRYKKNTDFPDLILIDGGKGHLNAVKNLFRKVTILSLSKRKETIFSDSFPNGKTLDQKNYASQKLIALRDYAHHFAISYFRLKTQI
jgi:excinuclease ABC subunit C